VLARVAKRDVVNDQQRSILRATPHFFGQESRLPEGVTLDDLSAWVRHAVAGVQWSSDNTEALRLLAYAHYSGALSEQDLKDRVRGEEAALASDFCHLADGLPPYPQGDLAFAVRSVLEDRDAPALRARTADEGWAICVLDLISVARPTILSVLLRKDPSAHIMLRWLLTGRTLIIDASDFAGILMARPEQELWRAAAALLTRMAREYVERDNPAPCIPKVANQDAQLVVAGLLLTQVFRFSRAPTMAMTAQESERWDQLILSLQQLVAEAMQTARDARVALAAQGTDNTQLLALVLGKTELRPHRQLSEAGDKLLKDYFRALKNLDDAAEERSLPYLAPVVLQDLIRIWIALKADTNFFTALRDNLRCDEYAYEFTYAHYLTDRPRAMALCVIAAIAAKHLEDVELLETARQLADDLRALPENGVLQPFSSSTRAQLLEQTALDLPAM
jgi:hypothetical protein